MKDEIRPLTRQLHAALVMDVWPSPATVVDFGIATPAHLGALQYAVKWDGVTMEQLDKALGKGKELQKLISSTNPYRDVTFETAWDRLAKEPPEPPRADQRQPGQETARKRDRGRDID